MTARDSVALYARVSRLYARVSSESQARDNMIASQVTALRERIAADGFQLEPDHNYVDEG
jgi:site-specific DNA recombinase